MSVSAALFRVYRPIMGWFGGILVAILAGSTAYTAAFVDARFSLWLTIANSSAKYWLLVVGIILISMQFRQFVANGVTRRSFLVGVAVFGLAMAVAFAVVVPLGHAIETGVLSLIGRRSGEYPAAGFEVALVEFGRVLPQSLAFFVSGTLIAAGFFRFRPWTGVVLIIPGLLPLGVGQILLDFDDRGVSAGRWHYPAALAATLLITAAGAAGIHAVMRDVAIRRTAG
jgi:uncharacterized membrane protein